MVEQLLELARRKADAAEVHLLETEARPIQFENNDLKYVNTKSSRVLSLRVIHQGRLGFASTTDPSEPERLVAQAVESAQFGQEARFAFPPSAPLPAVEVFDPRVAEFPVERGIQLGRDAIARVLGEFADVQCYVEISRSVGTERLVNTSGLDVQQRTTGFDCGLTAVRIRDGGILWVSDGESSRALAANFGRYTAKLIADIRRAETESPVPAGAVPVLFTAKAVGLLLQFLESAVNGKLVQKGASPLVGRLGDQVLGTEITIHDDGTRPFGDGTAAFDAEGVPARRTPVFERGVLRNYLFDLQTAGMLGAASTGNAGRGFAAVPTPEATNFVLEPGSATFAGLLAGIERGLLVDEVIGGGQPNVLAGEFSVNVGLGFLVERGELVGRVKDCMVAGNVFDLFKQVRGMGDTQEVHGPIVAPPVCFDGVHVAGGE
ncbi:MAG: TldD/PmbA family protein [Planctomycetes bacterium]|nr:TldD/PmbA family protein [Planctomycetota bacterium]